MSDASAVFSIVLILSAPHCAGGQAAIPAPPADPEQAIAAIERCMEQTRAPWPDEWRSEYVDTIRQAMAADPNAVPTAWHLAVLEQGFTLYWDTLAKSQDRPFFEVQCAEIRWYVERLMGGAPPAQDEVRRLHDQYEVLWDHAATSLPAQFPFLDPNAGQVAKADHLARRHRSIDAPLNPLYLHPLSEDTVEQVKRRWYDLRYDRVDFWRRLGGKAIIAVERADGEPLQTHPHYLLTQKSLSQWLVHIQIIAIVPPDYYLQAIRDRNEAERRRRQLLAQAWADENRLERQYHGQLLQTEYLSFLFAALLETASQEPVPTQGGEPNGQ